MLFVLLAAIVLVFTLMEFASGDPVRSMLGENATEEQQIALRENLGLDRPYLERLAHFAEGDTLGKLGVFFLGQACLDYPAAVGRVVFFHGCEPPFVGGFFQAAQAAKRRAWGGNPNKIPIGQNER